MLHYGGHFDFGLSDEKRAVIARVPPDEIGIVSKEGVYLSGDGYWYPQLNRALIAARVSVEMPEGWQVIAPGNGRAARHGRRARWSVEAGLDELTLVGGPLLENREKAGAIRRARLPAREGTTRSP